MEKFNLRKLNEEKIKEQYQTGLQLWKTWMMMMMMMMTTMT
jgi:hypothetical protein